MVIKGCSKVELSRKETDKKLKAVPVFKYYMVNFFSNFETAQLSLLSDVFPEPQFYQHSHPYLVIFPS